MKGSSREIRTSDETLPLLDDSSQYRTSVDESFKSTNKRLNAILQYKATIAFFSISICVIIIIVILNQFEKHKVLQIYHQPWMFLLRVAGPVFFVGMQLSAEGKVGDLSSLPYLLLFVNCLIWIIYGALKSDFTVLIPNLTGSSIGFICSLLYFQYCSSPPYHFYALAAIVFLAAVILGSLHMVEEVGVFACIAAVLAIGAPLATVKAVIRTKSTASMPFGISMMNFLNGLAWLLYGLLVTHDPLMIIPSAIGLVLAGLQLLLYVIYGLPPAPTIPF